MCGVSSSDLFCRFRVPEVMFQPSMLGVEQAGLAEVIEFILKKYPSEIQNNLVQVRELAKYFQIHLTVLAEVIK